MSTQRQDLQVKLRETGRANNRALRRDKKVPAVIYGGGKNFSICIEESHFNKFNLKHSENSLFSLRSDDPRIDSTLALIKEIVINPLTQRPQHIDFLALDVKKTVRVDVEIRFTGKPKGLADGGLLTVVNRQIEIECLPLEIPEGLTADISNLGVAESLHVSELTLPAGIKVLSPADMTLAVVNLAEDESTAATPAADAAAPAAAAAAAPAAAAKPGDKAAAAKPAAAGAKAAPKPPAAKK